MYTYLRVYMCIDVYACLLMCVYMSMYSGVGGVPTCGFCIYTCTVFHVCMCRYLWVYTCGYMCICICMCLCEFMCTHACMVHICAHAHTACAHTCVVYIMCARVHAPYTCVCLWIHAHASMCHGTSRSDHRVAAGMKKSVSVSPQEPFLLSPPGMHLRLT